MLFSMNLSKLLESFLLILNAMAIINERRVLRKRTFIRRLAYAEHAGGHEREGPRLYKNPDHLRDVHNEKLRPM
jgi:hypothetical protein